MIDVEEIIDYIKSLKKGFDKELFQSKIDELGSVVDSTGLEHDDFQTLFKLWLNLSIPITKWTNLGSCIVPQEKVKGNTVEYSLRWILSNYDHPSNFSRIAFLLDWLTAAMDCDSVDINALDMGYELYYNMLTFEVLSVHAIKLVYTLTKPADVTRTRVLELMDYAKKREAKKYMYRQLQVLLGLFKSYKPEYVPENVPSVSIHTVFKKINVTLLSRFKNTQSRRNSMSKDTHRLFWINPLNLEAGRNKKVEPLIPNMEFTNIGSKQYENDSQKTYLDFTDASSLLQYSRSHGMARPARLRSLLCAAPGLVLLAALPRPRRAFLAHDLRHLLTACFLETSPHSYAEKQYLLERLALFQSTIMQGLPVITNFLAQFLPFWNEKDFFAEILKLVEWVNVDGVVYINVILDTLAKIYYRAQPIEQCAILKSMTTMYTNLVYASTRSRNHFLSVEPPQSRYTEVLSMVSMKINDMCNKGLQACPDDSRLLLSTTRALVSRVRATARVLASGHVPGQVAGQVVGHVPHVLSLALPLLAPSAAALDHLAHLIMLYKEIFSAIKASGRQDEIIVEQRQILKFTSDFVSCFYEEFLTGRKRGIVASKLHPQLVSKLTNLIPDVDSKLSIRNHLAFAPYTYVSLQAICSEVDNKLLFRTVIEQQFASLSQFLLKAMPELQLT